MAPPKRKGFHLSQIPGNNHGGRARHGEGAAERHSVFAKWVRATLLGDAPVRGRVVDVGGGKGHLSASLAALGVRCTLVDPCAMVGRAGMMADGTSRDGGLADAPAAPRSSLVAVEKATLEDALLSAPRLVADAAAVVGMHPDEATECIVDRALAHSVPFAVVPCCATPNLFPQRRFAGGRRVKKYGGLVEYLLEKDPRMRCEGLSFAGRNAVVFMTSADYDLDRAAALAWLPTDYEPCAVAAKKGDLALLERLLATGNPWNSEVCQAAAWAGHHAVLRWARANDCPWSWRVVAAAAALGDNAAILRWALLGSYGVEDERVAALLDAFVSGA